MFEVNLIDCKYCGGNGDVNLVKVKNENCEKPFVVECSHCGIRTNFKATEKEATDKWNGQKRRTHY